MQNTYLTALHGMEGLFEQRSEFLGKFRKDAYSEAFHSYYEVQLPVFQALEEGYQNAIEKDFYLSNMADALVNSAAQKLDEVKKRQASNEKINLNLMMVAYILPALQKFNGTCVPPFVRLALERWKDRFPESNLSAGSFDEIESGFHRKWCYITTAVCENDGRSDDCYELTLLRDYRDGYLTQVEGGSEMIREYYDVAPTIVKRINKQKNRSEIYQGVWEDYIRPCIRMIELDQKEACCELYTRMVRDLEERYFYTHS